MLVKEKEKDLEKADEKGSLLIQDKKGEASSVIMETLKGLNQSWANLDHMVCLTSCILVNLLVFVIFITILFTHFYSFDNQKFHNFHQNTDFSLIADRTADGQSPVSARAVESV